MYRLSIIGYVFKRPSEMKLIVSVEGNIASGKSTLMTRLKEVLESSHDILLEPVKEWQSIENSEGINLLECFYRDMKTHSVLF